MLEAKLSPSMMCVDAWTGASETLHAMEANHIDYLHVDIMDGHFVPNFTLGTDFVKSLRKQSKLGWMLSSFHPDIRRLATAL